MPTGPAALTPMEHLVFTPRFALSRLRQGMGVLAWGLVSLGSGASPVAAVEFPDGRVAFDLPPYLSDAYTLTPAVFYPEPTYYFALSLAERAGEPLERVVIRQLANQELIYFVPEQTQAWPGLPKRDAPTLPLKQVTVDPDTLEITITFDPPIPPGELVTIGISPFRNPGLDGVYQFSVTAYPRGGSQAIGQEIGTGRLQFYRGSER